MKRDVKQVRKDIAKRKREKSINSQMKSPQYFSPAAFPQDEEKHGYLPFSTEETNSNTSMKDTFITSLMMKSILAGVLFFSVAIFFRMDIPWSDQPKQWASHALTEEFPFASVNHWYQETFGDPLALTPGQAVQSDVSGGLALPVNGTVSQSFQMNGQGIMINTPETSQVLSVDKGIVVFAGNDPETNKTVIIQHKDKSNTVYGNLTSINVHHYQAIAANEVVGEFDPSKTQAKEVFFGIEKDNKYIDPVQVMQVDERP